jgi:tetratricopeptide (TPR) repeat protein
MGKLQEAIDDFSRAIQLKSDVPSYYSGRGNIHWAMNRSQDALNDFSKSLELDPKFRDALIGRAKVYSKSGMPEQTIADASAAIELSQHANDNFDLFLLRASQYRKRGNTREALVALLRAFIVAPAGISFAIVATSIMTIICFVLIVNRFRKINNI